MLRNMNRRLEMLEIRRGHGILEETLSNLLPSVHHFTRLGRHVYTLEPMNHLFCLL